jgi:ABC-type branched-subunit amino acid transport system substrate-binding protein
MESIGYKFLYEDRFPPASSNFTADVVRMRQEGVQFVYVVSVNAPDWAIFTSEAATQNWHPHFMGSGIGYFGGFIKQSGGNANVEGQHLNIGAAMFLGEDATTVPEVGLFLQWIKQGYPNFPIDQFAAYSWANSALFVEALKAAGPKLTRKGLLAALSQIHDFNDHGLMAPLDAGAKKAGNCYLLLEIHDGKYVKVDDPPTGFRCDGHFHPDQG